MKLNIEGVKGCTDHGCIFGHPGGMGTNGGCACLRDIRPAGERLRLLRNVHLLVKAIEHLRNELTAARLERDEARNDLQELTCGDVMYTSLGREVERLRHEVSRLNMRCEAMGWMLYPHSDPAREAVAGDIGWPGSTALTAYDRLQAALFRHACYCGCGDPNPDLHHPDCVYRQAHG